MDLQKNRDQGSLNPFRQLISRLPGVY